MSSCQFKSFNTIRIDLLRSIEVTFATSHWSSSPLKAEDSHNTVAWKGGQLHLQSTRKKRRRKEEPRSKHPNSSNYIHHSTNQTPRANHLEPQEHVQVTLRHPQTNVSTWCNACRWHHPTTFARNEYKLKLNAQPTTLASSQHIPYHHSSQPLSPELNSAWMPLHHLLATNP